MSRVIAASFAAALCLLAPAAPAGETVTLEVASTFPSSMPILGDVSMKLPRRWRA